MVVSINSTKVNVSDLFGFDSDLKVSSLIHDCDRVPEIDESYKFDKETTLAILAGFEHNRRVMIQGYHGTGKSTHIEQIAARLNWPCVRVNLDSHISRIDLLGKDAIKLKDGLQVTEFQEGILPWALRNPCAIVFDEYDAGRPDVMFVIQRILETDGKLTLLDQNEIITPDPYFRLFCYIKHGRAGRHNRFVPRYTANKSGSDGQMVYSLNIKLPEKEE